MVGWALPTMAHPHPTTKRLRPRLPSTRIEVVSGLESNPLDFWQAGLVSSGGQCPPYGSLAVDDNKSHGGWHVGGFFGTALGQRCQNRFD
jgi:hypothetical protein